MVFFAVTGNYTPWLWFWAMDFLSAVAVTIRPMSLWQKVLAFLYMFQFGFHAGFAIMGGDPLRYLYGLDLLFGLQMLLVFTWTGGHGLYRLCRAHHWRSPMLDTVLGWTAR